MKIVDARDFNSVDKDYIDVPQPMQVYHSTEEFKMNESDGRAYTRGQIYKFLTDFFKDNPGVFEYNFNDGNIWVNTEELHIIDAYTRDGDAVYATRIGKLIPTDGCYIKIYKARMMMGHISVITSSGIWGVNGKDGSEITAGIPPALRTSMTWNRKKKRTARNNTRARKLKKFTEGKVIMKEDYSFVGKLLNPLHPHYLNQYGAGTLAYSNSGDIVSAKDLQTILNTPRVTELIMKELKTLMPELVKAIQKKNDPDTVADMLNRIAEWAIESDNTTVDDKLKSVQAIVSSGYAEEGIILNVEKSLLPDASSIPLLKEYDTTTDAGSHEIVPGNGDIVEEVKEQTLEEIKEDLGVLDEYVFPVEKPKPES